jgi:hypothetical protein
MFGKIRADATIVENNDNCWGSEAGKLVIAGNCW